MTDFKEAQFEDTHNVSIINNNTWSPNDYPQGWQKI